MVFNLESMQWSKKESFASEMKVFNVFYYEWRFFVRQALLLLLLLLLSLILLSLCLSQFSWLFR